MVLDELNINNSDVVLRGQGVGEDGTVLVAAGLDRRILIQIRTSRFCFIVFL